MTLKEATAACHAAKVKGSLVLVEEGKVALEALSTRLDLSKLIIDCMEAMIRSKSQIP